MIPTKVHFTFYFVFSLNQKFSLLMHSHINRSNLDPWDQYTDAQIWEALEKSHIKDMVSERREPLHHFNGSWNDFLNANDFAVTLP